MSNLIFFEKINFLFKIVSNVIIDLKRKSFMNNELTSDNFENDEKTEDTDYKNLLDRLKVISFNISLLEKTIIK